MTITPEEEKEGERNAMIKPNLGLFRSSLGGEIYAYDFVCFKTDGKKLFSKKKPKPFSKNPKHSVGRPSIAEDEQRGGPSPLPSPTTPLRCPPSLLCHSYVRRSKFSSSITSSIQFRSRRRLYPSRSTHCRKRRSRREGKRRRETDRSSVTPSMAYCLPAKNSLPPTTLPLSLSPSSLRSHR